MCGEQKGIKVLHVDDELDFPALTKAFLERENENFSIESATSAEEAIEFLKGAKYDVVVSDYQMPMMDGLEFLKTLRASGNTIPFIMFTGKGREAVAIEALNRGANHYLQKGTDIKSMYGTLAHVIKQEVETKRVEETLRKSEEIYRGFFKTSRDTAFITSKEGRLIDFNNVMLELFGYKTRDELSKIRISELYENPEDRKKHIKIIEQEGFAKEYPVNLRRKDGSVINTLITSVARKDENGNVIGYQGTIRDITERKQTEEKLRVEKEFSDRLFESSEICLLLINSKREIVRVNDAALKVFDRKREEVLGTICHEFICLAEKGKCPILDLGQRVDNSERVALNSKGEKIPVIKTVSKIEKEGETYLLESFIDITERKKAEEKLAKIFDGVNMPTFVINGEHKITYWNAAVETLTGVKREEVVGTDKQWMAFYAKNRPVMADLIVDKAPESKFKEFYGDKYQKSSLIEGAYEASDFFPTFGEEGKWLFFTAAPLRDPGVNIYGAIETLQDVSERKRAEEELRASEREHQIILDSVPVNIFHIDAHSRFVHVNEVLAKRYGMTPEDFKGKTSKELFPEMGEEYVKSDKEVLASGKPQLAVTRKIKTPGGVRWVRLDKVPIKDAGGNVTGVIGFELDITKRIEAQEELRNAHKELQDIIEFFPDATFVIDQDKKVIAWNLAMEEMTGVQKEDIIGEGNYAYAVPFYGDRRPLLIDLVSLSDKEIESRYEYIKREGNTLFAEAFTPSLYGGKGAHLWGAAAPLFDGEGNIVGAIESIRDITERKHAEEALRVSEEKYRSLVESTEDSVYLVDRDCRYLFMNEKHLSRIGMPKDQVIGKTYGELHSKEDTEEFAGIVEEVFETGKSVPHEHRSHRDNRYILRTLSPVKDSEGRVTAVTVVSKDITDRKQMEEELRSERDKSQGILSSLDAGVDIVNQDFVIEYQNKFLVQRFGDRRGEKCYVAYMNQDKPCEFCRIHKAIRAGETQRVELTGGDGSDYELSSTGFIDVDGQVKVIEVIRDITDRKKGEEERERLLNELEAKNTELERFTHTVSHDLRSPLVTIQGFTDMVQTDLAQNELEKAKDNLKFIDKAAITMDQLLSTTLQLSRIGRIANPPEDVPFGEIVEDALEQTAEQIRSSGVEVSVADDFPTVHVDRMRIAEVLVNLIVNSISYRGEESHPKIEIGYRIDNGERVFFVQDNGIGIDPGQHEKVFDLFYQVDTSGKKGTGAGLAIVKRIIEVHGGRIWIESEKGKGCTVCFTLPVV